MKFSLFLRILFFSFLPAALLYYSKSDSAIENIRGVFPDSWSSESIKNGLFVIGITLSALILPFYYEIEKQKRKKAAESINEFLKEIKKLIAAQLQKQFKTKDLEINVRVFRPKRGVITWLKNMAKKERSFVINNFDGLSEVGLTKGLCFKVKSPSGIQGIIGKVYEGKEICYDFNIKKNQETNFYNLDKNQLLKTSDVEFVIAAPIFKGATNDVIAIISIDGTKKVGDPASKEKEWRTTISRFCQLLHPHIPVLTQKQY